MEPVRGRKLYARRKNPSPPYAQHGQFPDCFAAEIILKQVCFDAISPEKSKSRYGSDTSKIEQPLSQTVRFDWNKNSFVPPDKKNEFVDSLGAYPSLQSAHVGRTGSMAGFVRRDWILALSVQFPGSHRCQVCAPSRRNDSMKFQNRIIPHTVDHWKRSGTDREA